MALQLDADYSMLSRPQLFNARFASTTNNRRANATYHESPTDGESERHLEPRLKFLIWILCFPDKADTISMEILFFADNFPPERNAQASRVYERACYWVRWGHKVTVITCAPNFPEGKVFEGYANRWYQMQEMSGIRVLRVKTYIAPNSGTYRRIADFLSYMIAAFVAGLFARRPDLVVATSPQFFGALGGCFLALVRRVPFVLELSDLWPESIVAVGAMKRSHALRLLEQVELWMYRRAVRIVSLTNAFKANLMQRGVRAAKIGVVLNGVDLDRYAPQERNKELAKTPRPDRQAFCARLHRNPGDGARDAKRAVCGGAGRRSQHTILVGGAGRRAGKVGC